MNPDEATPIESGSSATTISGDRISSYPTCSPTSTLQPVTRTAGGRCSSHRYLERLWLAPEPAERSGQNYLRAVSQEAVARGLVAERLALHTLHDRGHVTFRTYAITSTAFKAAAVDRGLDQVSAREYRLARLPRLVWVVEAVDRRKRRSGQPSVIGEAVFDSTSTDYDPRELIVRVPGALLVVQTDGTMRFPLATMRRACRSAAASQP